MCPVGGISEGNDAIPIQACYRLNSKSQRSATYEREVSALLKFFDDHFYLKNKVGYIVTLDEDFVENFGDIEIRAVSFINFFESKELPIFS
ncbi:MAG TPA: hypothetical protein PKB15_06390 [Acidimicrobiia bacterium]|nr:hypothetical protein [Acidimicrobiia bacterium]